MKRIKIGDLKAFNTDLPNLNKKQAKKINGGQKYHISPDCISPDCIHRDDSWPPPPPEPR